jgi:ferredoxin
MWRVQRVSSALAHADKLCDMIALSTCQPAGPAGVLTVYVPTMCLVYCYCYCCRVQIDNGEIEVPAN